MSGAEQRAFSRVGAARSLSGSVGQAVGKSVGEQLVADIDEFNETQRQSRMYRLTQRGEASPQLVAEYVKNLLFLTKLTPVHLLRAQMQEQRRGREALAAYFAQKWREEQGHHKWAERDLERLKARFGVEPKHAITRAMRALVAAIEESIDRDGEEYAVYILFAEYFLITLGQEFMNLLWAKCGIETTLVTILRNHVALDVEHASEGVAVLNDLVQDPAKQPKLRGRLAEFTHLVAEFFDELVEQQAQAA